MSITVTQYHNNFMIQAHKLGFRYTLNRLFSSIPGGIGHVLDTLFGINGTIWTKNPEENLHGPLGFFFGSAFAIAGLIIGQTLQIIFNAPSYLAHYLLDRPISFLIGPMRNPHFPRLTPFYFHQIMYREAFTPFVILGLLFSAKIYKPHDQMKGPFGFFIGAIPEITRFFLFNIVGVVTVLINKITDSICDRLIATKKRLRQIIFGKTSPKANLTRKLKSRLKFTPELKNKKQEKANQAKNDQKLAKKCNQICKQQRDIFMLFGLNGELYINQPMANLIKAIDKGSKCKIIYLHLDKFKIFENKFNDYLKCYREQDPNPELIHKANLFFAQLELKPNELKNKPLTEEHLRKYQSNAYNQLQLAKTILDHPIEGPKYLRWYKEHLAQQKRLNPSTTHRYQPLFSNHVFDVTLNLTKPETNAQIPSLAHNNIGNQDFSISNKRRSIRRPGAKR